MVIGDSLASLLAQRLAAEAGPYDVDLVDRAVWGCGIVRGGPYRYVGQVDDQMPKCDEWPQRWQADVAEVDPDVVLVLIGRWEVMDRVHDGRWMHLGEPDYDAYVVSELEAALPVLTARGARVVLCTAPYYHRDQPKPPNGAWPEDDPVRVDRENQLFRAFAARHPESVSIVDLGGRLSPDGRFTRVVDGMTVRAKDGVHLAPDIGRWAAPWLLPELRRAAPPAR
jgi:hypothetical protein